MWRWRVYHKVPAGALVRGETRSVCFSQTQKSTWSESQSRIGSGARWPGFKFWLYLIIAVWPWGSYLTLLNFGFFIVNNIHSLDWWVNGCESTQTKLGTYQLLKTHQFLQLWDCLCLKDIFQKADFTKPCWVHIMCQVLCREPVWRSGMASFLLPLLLQVWRELCFNADWPNMPS